MISCPLLNVRHSDNDRLLKSSPAHHQKSYRLPAYYTLYVLAAVYGYPNQVDASGYVG